MATLFGRAQTGAPIAWSGLDTPRTWLDHQHYLVCDDRSDAPRIPRHQLRQLFPDGAPRSWSLIVEKPRRPPRLVRATAAVTSVGLGLATVLSQAVAGFAADVFAWAGEVLMVAVHLVVLVAADGRFGAVGRLIGAAALVGALARLGWQLARWARQVNGDSR